MKLKPLHDRVVVKAAESEDVTKGGIFLPDTAKEKPQRGEVIAVGPGKTENGQLVAPQVKKGDQVLYGKYSGTEVTVDDVEYLIIRESDIMAIL